MDGDHGTARSTDRQAVGKPSCRSRDKRNRQQGLLVSQCPALAIWAVAPRALLGTFPGLFDASERLRRISFVHLRVELIARCSDLLSLEHVMLRQAVGKLLRPEFHHFKRPLIQGDGSTCTSASRSTTSCLPKTGTKFRCFNAALAEVQRWNCNKPGRADEESGGRPDQRQVCTLEPLSDVPGNSKVCFKLNSSTGS